jgi:23S rRNA pseudouridine2605 synthase
MTNKPKPTPELPVRLNKWVASSGRCSRRDADEWIAQGRVRINGKPVTQPGTRVQPERDTVTVDGQPIRPARKGYWLFHKPPGVVSTRSDEKGRKTLYDLLPPELHAADPAGRLDKESSGALLLSTDGDFLQRVTHPRYQCAKRYRVQVDKAFHEKDIEQLKTGIHLMPEDKLAVVRDVIWETPDTLQLTLTTGYNRQIRRSLEAVGYRVLRLKRLAVGPIRLGDLAPGQVRPLSRAEVQALLKPVTKGNKVSKKRP